MSQKSSTAAEEFLITQLRREADTSREKYIDHLRTTISEGQRAARAERLKPGAGGHVSITPTACVELR